MNNVNIDDVLYAPRFIIEPHQGTYLVIDPEAPNWINTNQYGIDALNMVNGRKTVRQITEDLSYNWGHAEASVKKDVIKFFEDVFEIRIISKEPFKYSPYTGRHKYLDYSRLSDLSVCLSTRTGYSGGLSNNGNLQLGEKSAVDLIDQAIDLGCRSVLFTCGEPFLLEYFSALIKKYRNKRLFLTIMTSGDLISEEIVKDIDPDVNFIISLQGSSAKLNDAIRGHGSFDAAVSGLNKLIDAGFDPVAQTTITSVNLNDIIPIAQLLINIGVKKIKLNWQRQGNVIKKLSDNKNILDTRALLSVLKKLSDAADASGVNLLNKEFLNANLQRRGVKLDLCSGGVDSLAVYADGESYPCQWLYRNSQFKLGNIHDKSLKEIWQNSVKLNKLRRNTALRNNKCYQCYIKYLCGGLARCYSSCAHLSADKLGDFVDEDSLCRTFNKIIHQSMRAQALPEKIRDIDCPVVFSSLKNNFSEKSDHNSFICNTNNDVKSFKPFYV